MPSTAERLRWIKPPRQLRSRDKLDRMLDAAEAFLEMKSFDDLTIQDVTRRTGTSVGTFYTRFHDKQALLGALYERHMHELHATTETLLDTHRWAGVPLERFIAELVEFTVRFHRRKRGLLRALVLESHARPDNRYDDFMERSNSTVARVGAFLAARCDEIAHSSPRLAGSLGFLAVLGAVREKILFSEGVARAVRVSDRALARELTCMYVNYLCIRKARK